MKVLCSLWLCWGKGDAKVAEEEVSPCAKAKDEALAVDGDVAVKRNDGGKQRTTMDNGFEDLDTVPTWRAAGLGGAKGCEGGANRALGGVDASAQIERHAALAGDMLRNERTLRALLQKAKMVLSEQNQAFTLERQASRTPDMHEGGPCTISLSDPELGRLNAQLLETCSVPKPDARALLRAELLLGDVRRWLAARPYPAAATAVLYAVGDGLVHAEHAVRSVGLVRYWQPDNASVFLALLQLYSDLLVQANRAAQLQRQQQQQQAKEGQQLPMQQHEERKPQREKEGPQQQRSGSGSDVVVLAADQELLQQQEHQQQQQRRVGPEKLARASVLAPQVSGVSVECSEQGLQGVQRAGAQAPAPPQVPLTFAVAALLLRPDWLDLLAEALELLHFSQEYQLAAARGGREPQEALGRALQLWCFLTQLVKFAAAHADSVQRMDPCLQRLGALLAPPSGAVPRLLELPLAEDTLVAQLHALWLLQVLYDMPDAKVLYSAPLADYFVALHHNAMVQSYEASAADPKSASAELCRIHATLLRSLARHPGGPVRAAFARVRTVEWLLQELSLESQLLAAAQQDGEAADPDSNSNPDTDDDEGSDITVSDTDSEAEAEPSAAAGEMPATEGAGKEASTSRRTRPLSPVTQMGTGAVAGRERVGAGSRKPSKGFSFTYDLNEDVERLIALEDEMGQEMQLDGFEYDEEGMQLKARSDAIAAAAAAAAAAALAAEVQPTGHEMQPEPQPLTQQASVGPPELNTQGSFSAAHGSSRPSSGVPRLALVGLRAASISSMAGSSPAAGRRVAAGRTSHTGNSTLGASSSRRADENDEDGADGEPEPSSDETRSPSSDAIAVATAAERVAVWSSTLADAYAAASAGDDSKLPYPPPRTRSRGSGCVSDAPLPPPGPSDPLQRPCSAEVAVDFAEAAPGRPREVTTGSPVHAGPHGELHLMVHSCGSGRAAQAATAPSASGAAAHGRPPLPTKPALPPLRMGSGTSSDALAGQPQQAASARAGPLPGSSRAMMVLSASNRYNNSGAPTTSPARDLCRQFHCTTEGSTLLSERQQQQEQQPQPHHTSPVPMPAGVASPASAVSDASAAPRRPPQPLIPALNLKSLRRRDGGAGAATTDTGRTVPLSSMLRTTNAGSLSNYSGMDSATTLLRSGGTTTTPASSTNTNYHCTGGVAAQGAADAPWRSGSGPLQRITETEQRPPEVAYQELACQRLLYQDRTTHILLLKVLLDLLVSPAGALDTAYVPQYPTHSGAPHAEFILLWHLNAPRNGGVVHDLCRGAQRRAEQAAAAAARRVAAAAAAGEAPPPLPLVPSVPTSSSPQPLQPTDSTMEHYVAGYLTRPQKLVAASAAVTAPSRAGAVTRTLQLLSRPLFDASRYSNLQFVARGTFGDVYRARMEPPRAQAWPSPTAPGHDQAAVGGTAEPAAQAAPMQVVIKTIQLPGSPHDSCVLADVFGEVAVMERFTGHDCICQLLDYGMRDDAYWLVMRRYRCSLAEWRGRQKPLADFVQPTAGCGGSAAAAAAAARVYLSALAQVVDALRLLASHHVVHFDLKCSNVLIEPLPGVRDGELWAPVGAVGDGTAAATSSGGGTGRDPSCVPFRCVLADFGEARAYRCAEEAFTARNRGTEVFKSPEMLMLNAAARPVGTCMSAVPPSQARPATPPPASPIAQQQQQPSASRPGSATPSPAPTSRGATGSRPGTAGASGSKHRPPRSTLSGAGLASDIWSLGCLAYELLSGSVLFGGDYASVTHRVAFGSGEQLTLTEAERARLAHLPQLVALVEWILVRDPATRPTLGAIRERVDQIRTSLAQ